LYIFETLKNLKLFKDILKKHLTLKVISINLLAMALPPDNETNKQTKQMKQNKMKMPKGTTHVIIYDGEKAGRMTVAAFDKLNESQIEAMGQRVEFVKIAKKAGAKPQVIGESVVTAAGAVEAAVNVVCDDSQRAAGIPVAVDNAPAQIADELTASWATWNCKDVAPIQLRDPARSILARFEYVPESLLAGNVKTAYSILRCSDNGKLVGKPFAGSYGLLDNNSFMGIIETIGAVIEKLGMKYEIATTGTLMDRERNFVSLKLVGHDKFNVDGREIQTFLNCLNSIPSNSGCTVTFANNTFTVCCRNTFAHALQCGDGTKFHAAIKHTSGMKAALADVPVLVEAYITGNNKLFATLKAFAEFPVSLADAEGYFAAFIGRDLKGNLTDKTELKTRSANIIETLKGLFVNGKGNKGLTAFDVFNAVTEYYTHMSAGESDNALKQYTSSEAGDGYVSKGEFYSWLIKHTQSAAGFQAVAKVGDTLLVNYRKAK
jgi:hypothetical protein